MARALTIEEIAPADSAPICCGCGHEVDPAHAEKTADYRLVCKLCAPRFGLGKKKRRK